MRYLFTIVLFSFCFYSLSARVRKPGPDSLVCLLMEGKVINALEGSERTCFIQLICENKVIDSVTLNGRKKFHFDLKKNKHYIIRISKPGYVNKNICVHTFIPDTQTDLFKFEFETILSEEKPGQVIDEETRNLPVASIYFHEKKNTFFYHKAFSAYYQKQLCKPYQ